MNHFHPDRNYNFSLGIIVVTALLEAGSPWATFSMAFSSATAYEEYAGNYIAFLASFWNIGKLGLSTFTLFILDYVKFNIVFFCYLGFNIGFLFFTMGTAKKIDRVPQKKYKRICANF